ncbi:hypothetical protein Bbelb_393760 [Branchiostoma belcheri]|nr:hypothetical protein Bbelb_393760 [Branchiostoma belcheri]
MDQEKYFWTAELMSHLLYRETYPDGRDYTIHSFELDSRLAPYFASYSNHVLHCPVAVAGKDVTRLDRLLHFGRAATGSLAGSRGDPGRSQASTLLAGNITAYAETAWRPDKGKVAGADMQWGGGSIYVWEAEKRNGNVGRHLGFQNVIPMVDLSRWIRKNTVWDGAILVQYDKLQSIQNRVGKLILKAPYRTPSVEILSRLGWKTVKTIHQQQKALLVYKALRNALPPYMRRAFSLRRDEVARNTRSASTDCLISPRPHLEAYRRSLAYSGSVEDYVIFKIDVEGAEYEILEKMLKEGTFKWIDKVYGEFHGWQLVTDWPKERKQGLQDALNASGITMLDWVGERKTFEDMETLCPVDISEDTPGAAGGVYSNCTRSPGGPARLALTVLVGMNRTYHYGTGRDEQVGTQVITELTLTVLVGMNRTYHYGTGRDKQVGTQVITELTLTVQVGMKRISTQVITELTMTVQVKMNRTYHYGTGRDKQVGTQVITELTLTVQVGMNRSVHKLSQNLPLRYRSGLTGRDKQVGKQVITELTVTVQVGMNRTYRDGTGRDEQVGTQVITEPTITVQVGINRTYHYGTGRDEQVGTQVITELTLTVQVGMNRTYHYGTGRDEQVGTQVITELTLTVQVGMNRTYHDGTGRDKQVGTQVITELTLAVQVGMNRKAAHKLVETIRAHHSNMPVTLFVYGDFVQEYPDLVTQWAQRYTIGMREMEKKKQSKNDMFPSVKNAPFPEDHWDLQNTNVVRMGMISAVQRMREVGLQPAYFYPSSLSNQVKNEASRRGLRIIQSTTKFPPNIGTLLTEENYYRFRDVERTPKALRILHERISYGGILTLDSDHPDSYMISAFLMDYLYENSGFEIVNDWDN